jgi:CheY-like chemotaxis protein
MDFSSMAVLVVDDNDMDRYILCRQLDHLKIKQISQSSNQADALSLLKASISENGNIPHLILIDYYLGDTKGSECAKKVKALFEGGGMSCPLLVLMSSASIDELQGELASFDASLSKGTSIDDLSQKFQALLA